MLRMSRLSNDDGLALLGIARQAITSVIVDNVLPDFPPFPAALSEPGGAFVSLYCNRKLRGCVGQLENPGPLADVVARAAISAAQRDSRFRPIQGDEIPDVKIEISVLSRPQRILAEEIVVGRHGLLVARGPYRGILLPQVATERCWTGRRFLEETCVKAGLPRDAWRDGLTELFGFTAEVYSEKEP